MSIKAFGFFFFIKYLKINKKVSKIRNFLKYFLFCCNIYIILIIEKIGNLKKDGYCTVRVPVINGCTVQWNG